MLELSPDRPAFTVAGVLDRFDPVGPPAPVLFDSPHSGDSYPPDFRPVAPPAVLRQAEDAWVDELFGAAPRFGATLIRARFPRIYIDPNRAADDLDPDLVEGAWPGALAPGEKTRLGVGLIWRFAPPGTAIYDRKLPAAEVRARIDRYYDPYHDEIARVRDRLFETFGAVWYVDCHSMPGVGGKLSPDPDRPRPDFAIGDRDGTTCEAAFTEFVVETLRGMGYDVRVNDPYKGAELVRRYGEPESRRHGLQIEVNRRLYMDEARHEKHEGFEPLREALTRLAEAIVGYARAAA